MSAHLFKFEIEKKIEKNLPRYSNLNAYPAILLKKSKFSEAEILRYTRKGCRWMIRFNWIVNPKTGETKTIKITNKINQKFKGPRQFKEKRKYLLSMFEAIEDLLKGGTWEPTESIPEIRMITSEKAIDYAMGELKRTTKPNTYRGYHYHVEDFKKYLKQKRLLNYYINNLDQEEIELYLKEVEKRSSARNRNNHKGTLSAVFTVLRREKIIPRNFILDIENLKTKKKTHRPFTDSQMTEIWQHMEQHHSELYQFVRVFSYQFIRPHDAVNIRCKDIHLEDRLIDLETKTDDTGQLSRRPIPKILLPLYEQLLSHDHHPDDFLFTPSGQPGAWDLREGGKGRRNYWTEQFRKKVKKPLGLGDDQDMYGCRHTTAITVLKNLAEEVGSLETAKNRLMEIGGWKSRKSLDAYLGSIQIYFAGDWSKYL